MISWPELRMSMRPLPFLDSKVDLPGGVLRLRSRPAQKLLVWHPDAIDWIFRSDQLLRHPGSRSLTPLFGRRSLLWAEDSRHAAYRQVLGPPLRGRRLADYRDVIAEIAHAAIDPLRPGTVLTLPTWTRGIALRIIARIILGRSDTALLGAFTGWIERALGPGTAPSPTATFAAAYPDPAGSWTGCWCAAPRLRRTSGRRRSRR